MNDESKPSLAAGMAKRSFWIAVAGGWTGMFSRMDALGNVTRALLGLVTISLLLIAVVFGAVALIRITSADRRAVLMPALGGLLLGLALLANQSNWARDHWVRARIRASQAQESQSTPSRPHTEVSPQKSVEVPAPKSSIQYSLPALEQIPQATAEIRAGAGRSTGDDSAVLRAWVAHLEKLHAAYTNTLAASNRLHEVDLLDPKLISTFDQDEPVRRRRLANEYASAWRALGQNLSTFSGSYYSDLHDERVSHERATVERQALSRVLEQPETAARVAALRKLCSAEETVGRHYNYAVSALFTFAQLSNRAPNLGPTHRNEMDKQVAKLKEVEQAATDARREVWSQAGGTSREVQARSDTQANP